MLLFVAECITTTVVLDDLDLNLLSRSNIWYVNISKTVRADVKMRGWHLHALMFAVKWHNVNVVLHDLDIYCQFQKFETPISRKWWKLAQKCYDVFIIDFDICNRMTQLRMLCSITFTFTFKVKHLSCYAFAIKLCNDSGCHRKIFLIRLFSLSHDLSERL